jgi:NADP-dependent 3-hydroxy acid dehydrogenase YdfG
MNSAGRPIAPDSEERRHKIEPDEVAEVVCQVCVAPPHVSIGNVTVWPLGAGIRSEG